MEPPKKKKKKDDRKCYGKEWKGEGTEKCRKYLTIIGNI